MTKTDEAAQEPQVKNAKADEIFRLVKDKDGVKITLGNYLITRKVFKSFQQAEDYLNQKPYEILINVACLMAEKTCNELLKNEKK